MPINSAAFKGDSNIGVYVLATSKFAIVSKSIIDEKNLDILRKTLKVPLILTDIAGSSLVGVLLAGNSNVIFAPFTIHADEKTILEKETGAKVVIVESKKNALGNLIVMNEKGVILSPVLPKKTRETILEESGLDGEIMRIANIPTVGAAVALNNYAALVHPKASDAEIEKIRKILGVEIVERGTINGGSPYVRSGIIVNDNGAVVGMNCTGMELMKIYSTFEL